MVPLSQAPFELAIFDVDGTLNRVEAWWPDLIREGVALFSAQAGLELETPDDARALAVVGNKDEEVWGPFLPPECRQRWGDLRDLVLPMEVALLRSGVDYLYVGVDETLGALRDVEAVHEEDLLSRGRPIRAKQCSQLIDERISLFEGTRSDPQAHCEEGTDDAETVAAGDQVVRLEDLFEGRDPDIRCLIVRLEPVVGHDEDGVLPREIQA